MSRYLIRLRAHGSGGPPFFNRLGRFWDLPRTSPTYLRYPQGRCLRIHLVFSVSKPCRAHEFCANRKFPISGAQGELDNGTQRHSPCHLPTRLKRTYVLLSFTYAPHPARMRARAARHRVRLADSPSSRPQARSRRNRPRGSRRTQDTPAPPPALPEIDGTTAHACEYSSTRLWTTQPTAAYPPSAILHPVRRSSSRPDLGVAAEVHSAFPARFAHRVPHSAPAIEPCRNAGARSTQS